jgi:hypothetical protein
MAFNIEIGASRGTDIIRLVSLTIYCTPFRVIGLKVRQRAISMFGNLLQLKFMRLRPRNSGSQTQL